MKKLLDEENITSFVLTGCWTVKTVVDLFSINTIEFRKVKWSQDFPFLMRFIVQSVYEHVLHFYFSLNQNVSILSTIKISRPILIRPTGHANENSNGCTNEHKIVINAVDNRIEMYFPLIHVRSRWSWVAVRELCLLSISPDISYMIYIPLS